MIYDSALNLSKNPDKSRHCPVAQVTEYRYPPGECQGNGGKFLSTSGAQGSVRAFCASCPGFFSA
jgi:hypothetical protein